MEPMSQRGKAKKCKAGRLETVGLAQQQTDDK